MATPPTAQPFPTRTQPLPAQKSTSLPALVVVAGWLVPGLGHLLLGKYVRALLLFVSILGMFFIGISLQGKIYTPTSGEILDMLGFAGELGMGVLYAISRLFSIGAASAFTTLADYGSKFLIVAGVLNIIAAVDAHSLASGRKASL